MGLALSDVSLPGMAAADFSLDVHGRAESVVALPTGGGAMVPVDS
jgi:hypothetical protein